ncbi:MAG: hypothetical protein ACKVQA_14880 [Burkholderiales bacterium]
MTRVREHSALAGAAVVAVLILAMDRAHGQAGLTGYLDYQGRWEGQEVGVDAKTHLATLRTDFWSSLGPAWVGELSGGLGLTFSDTSVDGLSQSGTEVTGGAKLRLLPRSWFPFEAFAERSDSRIDGELAGPDHQQTTYGFTQSFVPPAGARYGLSYRHTDRAEIALDPGMAGTNTAEDFVNVTINRAFQFHQIDFRSDYDHLEQDNPWRSDLRTTGVLRHRYSPGAALSIESQLFGVETDFERDLGETQTSQYQLNSNLFWRPRTEKPLFISGSLLGSQFDQADVNGSTDRQFVQLSGNASYQRSPALSLRASASLANERTSTRDGWLSSVRGGASYAPADIPLGKWRYRYSLGADVGNRSGDTEGSVQDIAASLSHGVSRPHSVWKGSGGTHLTQQLGTTYNSEGNSESTLQHTAIWDWNRYAREKTLSMRAMASDSRRIDGIDITFQMVNFQVTGTHQISRQSSWTGNVTAQSAASSNQGARTPWLSAGSANITYHHFRALNIPRLRFSSELRAMSEGLAQAVAQDGFSTEQRELWSWANRFDYTIGLTQLSLRGQVQETEGNQGWLLNFLLRRYFGMRPR